ncbi:hypothetical protein K443DRAFT_198119 [Laccaria amethystina LaAM-08-1]|uniref:Uncharacterized protein n=1 Tax=Laccaria amethystina LaAM-08-1 TaxID=1095629 RepID=A0A0C9XRS1_9AGAR|nr:hypothetical protein K443DRAFT_198119 [Laccaria amethystina LaAM-08-1]
MTAVFYTHWLMLRWLLYDTLHSILFLQFTYISLSVFDSDKLAFVDIDFNVSMFVLIRFLPTGRQGGRGENAQLLLLSITASSQPKCHQ